MAFNFNKNIVVGVSVTPERGLEVAQIDYSTGVVLKYGCKPIAFDNIRREIADRDIFKETLAELLSELQIPTGSEIVLNLPPVAFNVIDYPASLNEQQRQIAIEEELVNHPIFQNVEPAMSIVSLPNSTMQFTKVAYAASQRNLLEELAIQIKDLKYNLVAIDTSINSNLNSLIYNNRLDISSDVSWVLLLIENNFCRILSIIGKDYVDYFEERITIGEVLGEEENCETILNAISPILKNLPSKYLYVVSKTDSISAKTIAERLSYNGQIVHQDANVFSQAPFLQISSEIDSQIANSISLDVIGAAIYKYFLPHASAKFNLFNEMLGDIYLSEQPFSLKLSSSKTIVFSTENAIKSIFKFFFFILIITAPIWIFTNNKIKTINEEIEQKKKEIARIDKFLEENKQISSETFSESYEIKRGLSNNKNIYSYYTIVGTEIPKKLWLTHLRLDKYVTIDGQADNLESIYSFFRNIKDYDPASNIKLQKLALAANTSKLKALSDEEAFDTDSIITSMNADFYEFCISSQQDLKNESNNSSNSGKNNTLPLEPLR